jgi:hypothetical protein
MDDFEELTENQATGALVADAPVEEAAIVEPEPVAEPVPAPAREPGAGRTVRSTKQRSVDAARAEKLKELKARYNTEFANIQNERRRPKPKAYNAASVLSAANPEDRIRQILARDRGAYNAKQANKKTRKARGATAIRRNAPSILAETRSEAKRIRDNASRALLELKAKAEAELRAIGSNISELHSLFNGTRSKPGPKSKSNAGQNLE